MATMEIEYRTVMIATRALTVHLQLLLLEDLPASLLERPVNGCELSEVRPHRTASAVITVTKLRDACACARAEHSDAPVLWRRP